MRIDGRKPDELRQVSIIPDFVAYPEGSVLITFGETKVLCNVSIEETVPNWMLTQRKSGGWITAEYALLPRSTLLRTPREIEKLRGRTLEIQRMIGRSLRAAIDLDKLGPRTCIVDCDVIQADGGTRTAAITGGFVSLAFALRKYRVGKSNLANAIKNNIAAVSVGIIDGRALLDLCYSEDILADVDATIAMTACGEFVEIQSTAEKSTFSHDNLEDMLNLAYKGIGQLLEIQRKTIAEQPG